MLIVAFPATFSLLAALVPMARLGNALGADADDRTDT